jgi:hypothetical protein
MAGAFFLALVVALPLLGQQRADRDLLEGFPEDPAGEVFVISFLDRGELRAEPTLQGREQLVRARSAFGAAPYRDGAVIVEAWVCRGGMAGADPRATRVRAEAVRRYLAENNGIAEDRLFLLVREEVGGLLPESEHLARHGEVLVRGWGDEQMADLAPFLMPPPPAAEVWFRSRTRDRGEFQVMPPGGTLVSGDEFQIEVNAREPVFIYVFHRGSGGLWDCLYASGKGEGEGQPAPKDTRIVLPHPGKGYVLDNTPGTEETFVFLGRKPDQRLDAWALEGVPWHSEAVHPEGDSGRAAVRVRTPADRLNWFRRFRFAHQPRGE